MSWMLFVPTFRAVLELVGANPVYPFLMNLSVIVTLACFVAGLYYIRIADAARFRRWSGPVAVGSLAICAALVYYYLYIDLGQVTSELVGNVLAFLTSSAVVFAFWYTLCVPFLLGLFLALFVKSLGSLVGRHVRTTGPRTRTGTAG